MLSHSEMTGGGARARHKSTHARHKSAHVFLVHQMKE